MSRLLCIPIYFHTNPSHQLPSNLPLHRCFLPIVLGDRCLLLIILGDNMLFCPDTWAARSQWWLGEQRLRPLRCRVEGLGHPMDSHASSGHQMSPVTTMSNDIRWYFDACSCWVFLASTKSIFDETECHLEQHVTTTVWNYQHQERKLDRPHIGVLRKLFQVIKTSPSESPHLTLLAYISRVSIFVSLSLYAKFSCPSVLLVRVVSSENDDQTNMFILKYLIFAFLPILCNVEMGFAMQLCIWCRGVKN